MADSPTNGEWWRVGGRVLGAGAGGDGGTQPEESVYAAQVPAAAPPPPSGSSSAGSSPGPSSSRSDVPRSDVPRSDVPLWDRSLTGTGAGSGAAAGADSGRRSVGEDVTARFPGWDAVKFYPFEEPAPAPVVPDPREGDEDAEPGPKAPGAKGARGPVGRASRARAAEAPVPEAAEDAVGPPVRPGLLAGRRPAPLLLVAALALLAGAYTGVLLAMLAGWGAAYLSRGLGDVTKKFAVLGIPMICMTGATVWFWGRAQGRWGTPVSAGTPMGEVTWSAAPGVLRVAAVLTALFLLAVTLRRRREP
ncbi:hypothetical protein [Kitasatospora sp. NPDC088346]|uniref:hypothetical protein n=1 Tax=Kitasatospora sp. NPDC088346 TaxID=3364073 RepID=UPI0038024AF3